MVTRADRWITGVTLAAVLTLASALLALGVSFYGVTL